MLWWILWRAHPLLLVAMIGCAGTPRVVRVDTQQGRTVVSIPRSTDVRPVVVGEAEFQRALRHLAREVRLTGTPRETVEKTFQLDPLSGNYLYLPRDKSWCRWGRVTPWKGR